MSDSYKYKKTFYDKRRKEAKSLLGGVCVICGTTERLEFDHIDPKTKLFDISQGLFHEAEKFWAEVAKCQLLCRSHHEDKSQFDGSNGTRSRGHVTHGTKFGWQKSGCYCDLCDSQREAFNVERKESRKNLKRLQKG